MENARSGLRHPASPQNNKRTFQDAFEDLPNESPISDGDAPVPFPILENNISDTHTPDSNVQRMFPSSRALVPVALLDLVEEERREWSSERHRQKIIKTDDGHVGQSENDMLSIPLRPKSSAAKPVAEPQLLARTGTAGLPIRARTSLENHPLPLLKDTARRAASVLSPELPISNLILAPEVGEFDQNIQLTTPKNFREE